MFVFFSNPFCCSRYQIDYRLLLLITTFSLRTYLTTNQSVDERNRSVSTNPYTRDVLYNFVLNYVIFRSTYFLWHRSRQTLSVSNCFNLFLFNYRWVCGGMVRTFAMIDSSRSWNFDVIGLQRWSLRTAQQENTWKPCHRSVSEMGETKLIGSRRCLY